MCSSYDSEETRIPYHILSTPFGQASYVSLKTFFEEVLPEDAISLDRNLIVKRLTCRHEIVTKSGRLWGYGQKKPSDFSRQDAYQHVATGARRVVKAVPGLKQNWKLINSPNIIDKVDQKDKNALPDAYFCRLESTATSATWQSIAVSGVYAEHATEKLATVVRGIVMCLSHFLIATRRTWRESHVAWAIV